MKRKIQVTLTDTVYARAQAMADLRGVTVATYMAYVVAETSMTQATFQNSISNIPASVFSGVTDAADRT